MSTYTSKIDWVSSTTTTAAVLVVVHSTACSPYTKYSVHGLGVYEYEKQRENIN